MTDNTTPTNYISAEMWKLLRCGKKMSPLTLSTQPVLRNDRGVTKFQTRFVATHDGHPIDVYDAIFSQKTEPLLLVRILLSLSQCGCCARHSHGLLSEHRAHCANTPEPSTSDYICDCPCRHFLRNYYKLCYWVSKAPEAHNEADILAL